MNVETDGKKRYKDKKEIDASFDLLDSILTELFVQASEYNKYLNQGDQDKCNKCLSIVYSINRILTHTNYEVNTIIDAETSLIEDITVNGIGVYKNLPEATEEEINDYYEAEYTEVEDE